MVDASSVFAGAQLDVASIHRVLYEDFNLYQEDFEAHRVSEAQRVRGGMIQWWAAFAPEVFPADLEAEMKSLVRRSSGAVNHVSFGWHQSLFLRGALVCLTGDADWIREGLRNLSHHSSGMRERVGWSLALIAPGIPCDHRWLLNAIEENFTEQHFGTSETIALFAAAHGSKAEKLDCIEFWSRKFGEDVPDYSTLAQLLERGSAANPFHWVLGKMNNYVALRMSTMSPEPPIQLSMALAPECTEVHVPSLDEVWTRMEEHPLLGRSSFTIADVDPLSRS